MIGGMDEDFAGHYGLDDIMLKQIFRNKFSIETLPISLIMRENENNDLDRDATINKRLYKSKMESIDNGTYCKTTRLRFKWNLVEERILLV
jgi:hypothetical protein